MFYAITLKDNIITGVHESMTPITSKTFAKNPVMVDHEVVELKEPLQYRTGMNVAAYEADGTMKPELYCIEQGYLPMPPNKEIIDGVLVDKTVTEEDAPPTIQAIITQLKADNNALKLRLETQEKKADIAVQDIVTLKGGKVDKPV